MATLSTRAAARASHQHGPNGNEAPAAVVAGLRLLGAGARGGLRLPDSGWCWCTPPTRQGDRSRRAPQPVPHRPAAARGRTRLRAPDRGSGERRRHRPGCPFGGWQLRRRAGGGAADIRTRPAPRSAPRSHCPAPTERRGPLTPPPKPRAAIERPAVWLHSHGLAPGTGRGHQRPGLRADPGWIRGQPGPDHMGPDVTPVRAGDIRPLPGLYLAVMR
jgi:hypothetical protein